MKTLTTITALLSGIILSAQTTQFQISVAKDQSLASAFTINTMNVEFSPFGSNFTDTNDVQGAVTNSALMYPYTVNASYLSLLSVDARPEFQSQMNLPFGTWSTYDADMHVQGSWINPADTLLYDVILKDNQTNLTYNLYTEVVIPVLADTGFAYRFTIKFVPKGHYVPFDESCNGQNNGSVFAESPVGNWTVEIHQNGSYLNTVTVTNTDTLFQNLSQGTYDFIYILNNSPVDTSTAVVSGPAPVVSSATLSNANPLTNEQVIFTNTSTGAMDYLWDFGDGSPTTNVASPSYTYTSPGTYTVTLIAYNVTGCDNIVTYTVTVTNGTMAPSPQLQDRNNTQAQSTLRTSDITIAAQNGQAHVSSTTETAIEQYSVYSLNGQVIHSGNANSNSFTYDTPGIYVIHVVYADGTESTKRMMLN